MKVQTAVLLLCFLSGVFLSVVHAKPSPTLMRELIALEKYLEKKEGSDNVDGQKENEVNIPTINDKIIQEQTENVIDKLKNENNNNGEGETKTEEGLGEGGDGGPHANEPGQEAKPDAPNNAKEESGPSVSLPDTSPEEESSSDSGAKGEVEKPQEGSIPSPSDGQVEKDREQTFAAFDDLTRKIKDLPDKLSTLKDKFREQFQNDDRKFQELKKKFEETREKTKEKLGQLKTVVEDMASANRVDSVRENAPARRSHISDTEFLNMLHSLLTYS
ncbi:hypothetical protein CHS0354_038326 [Potamilus streckersoni]|uniref:Uncharacterized protein n=1 Tax=Potamilus streckersoni TaxID=2493646 RepID=A0AAE0RQB8_9BIVA|nr:hypothetical protein CHS0354_038326 [Potamilus streckersoni]